jgi:hypothetical protein
LWKEKNVGEKKEVEKLREKTILRERKERGDKNPTKLERLEMNQ